MLDTLDVRLAQAHAGELGHVEFLEALCEDEVTRRQQAALERRVRAARFERICTLEEFDFSYNPKTPTAVIRDLATLHFIEAGESIVLHGPVGVGESHIAQALGHLACRNGHSVAFTKTSRLLSDLAGGRADRSWETRLRRWVRPAVLILDDFAMPGAVSRRPHVSDGEGDLAGPDRETERSQTLLQLVAPGHDTLCSRLNSPAGPCRWAGGHDTARGVLVVVLGLGPARLPVLEDLHHVDHLELPPCHRALPPARAVSEGIYSCKEPGGWTPAGIVRLGKNGHFGSQRGLTVASRSQLGFPA